MGNVSVTLDCVLRHGLLETGIGVGTEVDLVLLLERTLYKFLRNDTNTCTYVTNTKIGAFEKSSTCQGIQRPFSKGIFLKTNLHVNVLFE